MPNFTDNKVPLGVGGSANIGRYNAGEVPNITGGFNTGDRRTHIQGTSGAIYRATVSSSTWGMGSGDTGNTQGVGFDASRSSSVYKNVSRVIAHGVMMFYCIKY